MSDVIQGRVDADFIHAAPGFPMLLRNAHSFAVRLCKCGERHTGGALLSDRAIMNQASVFSISGNEKGGLKRVTNESKGGWGSELRSEVKVRRLMWSWQVRGGGGGSGEKV